MKFNYKFKTKYYKVLYSTVSFLF